MYMYNPYCRGGNIYYVACMYVFTTVTILFNVFSVSKQIGMNALSRNSSISMVIQWMKAHDRHIYEHICNMWKQAQTLWSQVTAKHVLGENCTLKNRKGRYSISTV